MQAVVAAARRFAAAVSGVVGAAVALLAVGFGFDSEARPAELEQEPTTITAARDAAAFRNVFIVVVPPRVPVRHGTRLDSLTYCLS